MRTFALALLGLIVCGSGVSYAQDDSESQNGPETQSSDAEEAEDNSTEAAPASGEKAEPADPGAQEAGAKGDEPIDVPVAPPDLLGGGDADFLQSEAVRAPDLSENQIQWLKPLREQLKPIPRAQVDFTAYALKWGEVKIGLANISVGVAPRVQVGTSPMLNAMKIYNANAKANFLRWGRFDLAAEGSYYTLPLGDFRLTYRGGGARLSVIVIEDPDPAPEAPNTSDGMSIHLGFTAHQIGGGGTPDVSGLNPWVFGMSKEELEEWSQPLVEAGATIDLDAQVYAVNFATDYRFNRRDSLIFQLGAWLNVNANAAVNVPPIAGLEEAFNETRDYSLGDAYTASLAYHIAGKHWEFRFGVGLSSASWAWLLQSTDLSYRFGGSTRMDEWRTRRTWRKNASDVQR